MSDVASGRAVEGMPTAPRLGFIADYRAYLRSCLTADHDNKGNYRRLGLLERMKRRLPARSILRAAVRLEMSAAFNQIRTAVDPVRPALALVESDLPQWRWLYESLVDVESRTLLVKLLAYRGLDRRMVKLPLNTTEYWNAIYEIEQLGGEECPRETGYREWRLARFDLNEFGYPVCLYSRASDILTQFICQQYRCKADDCEIVVDQGDIVIDAGACYGDTALYFASRAGAGGLVISFEFLPQNISIFEENISLNPSMQQQIELIQAPLWSSSNQELFIHGAGPATCVTEDAAGTDMTVRTVTIDDVVRDRGLDRVDFVKMDIEGAEVEALRGAEETLQEFKPKLAICVYHRLSDFWSIPRYLSSLNCGYEFYIRHFSPHQAETVLFARAC